MQLGKEGGGLSSEASDGGDGETRPEVVVSASSMAPWPVRSGFGRAHATVWHPSRRFNSQVLDGSFRSASAEELPPKSGDAETA